MGLQATVLREIFLSADSYGAAYDALCDQMDISHELLSDSKVHIEWQKAAGIWDVLAKIFESREIGLQFSSTAKISMNGMIGFLMQCSQTLEEAVSVYCEYGYMVCPMVRFSISSNKSETIVEMSQNKMWQNTFPENAVMAMDFTIGCFIHFSKQLAGKFIYPKRVYLEGRPRYKDAYIGLLKCPVYFNNEQYRMVFDSADMKTPITSSEQSLFQMFNSILAKKKVDDFQESSSKALKQVLMMQFKGRIPTVEQAAEAMHMSIRTLQRSLKEEGTNFREIASDVRKEVSIHFMKNCSSNVTEIANLMGYADLPSFRRAFKNWTNETPRNRRLKEQTRMSIGNSDSLYIAT
jgi:AraC-like DNA-binding protein